MIKSGYIVLNDYDKTRITDKEQGERVRLSLMNHIKRVISGSIVVSEKTKITFLDTNVQIVFEDRAGNQYTAIICTVNHLVNKNKISMKQNASILPFNKDMDKYGTLYLSISTKESNPRIQAIIDGFIDKFIKTLNDPEYNVEFSYSDAFIFVPAIKTEEYSYETSSV